MKKINIRKLTKKEIRDALALVLDVFNKYEATHYPKASKEAFCKAICSNDYLNMLMAYGAFDKEKLIGIIATRNNDSHIALFFVHEDYQKQGIGRLLFNECLKENINKQITVNSSVYAVRIYERLGFEQIGSLKEENGIRYIPMIFKQ